MGRGDVRNPCVPHVRLHGVFELLTLWMVCCAFGHASQPGKSNTQYSWLEPWSAAVISKRQLNLIG